MKKLLDYDFEFVDYLSPVKDRNGQIKEFHPQDSYAKKDTSQLNKHGEGVFCRFSIHPKWSNIAGIYAFFIDDELVYVGQCLNFATRINMGYGNISPKNCYVGGQSTNCKINKVVLNAAKEGKKVALFFHINPNYDAVERELIAHFNPKYNVSLVGKPNQTKIKMNKPLKLSVAKTRNTDSHSTTGSTESVRKHIIQTLMKAKEEGLKEYILVSGDIHKDMSLENRMPIVCGAMYNMMKLGDEILHTTPSGKSSTIKIKYYL